MRTFALLVREHTGDISGQSRRHHSNGPCGSAARGENHRAIGVAGCTLDFALELGSIYAALHGRAEEITKSQALCHAATRHALLTGGGSIKELRAASSTCVAHAPTL